MTAPATAIRLPNNRFLKPAIETLDGYKEALARADQADKLLRELKPPAPVPAKLDPHNTGGPTLKWLDALDDHDKDVERHDRHRRRLLASKQASLGEAASILRVNVNDLLSVLNDRLTELLYEVAEVADKLEGTTTAEQAIGRGVAPAWKSLSDLAGHYAELRAAQEYVLLNLAPRHYWTTCRPILGGEDTGSLAVIRNLDDVWPSWTNPGLAQQMHVDGTKQRGEPWPSDPVQLLLWLVTSLPAAARQPAHVWIPTLTEIDELFAERRDRDNPTPDSQPARLVLNQAPQPPGDKYSRVVTPLETSTPPIDLDIFAEGK